MRFYSRILRYTIHVIAAAILVLSSLAAIAMASTIDMNFVFATVIGLVVGAVFMSLIVGTLALLYEIRDFLAELNEEIPE